MFWFESARIMSLIKINPKGQVTIPTELRRRAGLNAGDLLDAKLERGKLTLTPRTSLDRDIAESLDDLHAGRTYGPFDTVDGMMQSLRTGRKRKTVGRAKRT